MRADCHKVVGLAYIRLPVQVRNILLLLVRAHVEVNHRVMMPREKGIRTLYIPERMRICSLGGKRNEGSANATQEVLKEMEDLLHRFGLWYGRVHVHNVVSRRLKESE